MLNRLRLLLLFGLPALVCACWTVYAGKDINWDLLNYHYYLPFEFLERRVHQDFFAASAQSYLNPVGYLPFYLMVSVGWHSVLVSVVLAALHSVSIGLLYVLCWKIFAHLAPRDRTTFALLGAIVGVSTSVFWPLVGTSFLDPLLLPLMLGGLLLLLREGRLVMWAALAGVLLGGAAALKYSNAIFALAGFPLSVFMRGARGSARLKAGLAYIAGGALAVAAIAGPWLVWMYREFGNPVFPLFNAWFQSPDGPSYNLASLRFTPTGWIQALTLPFRMATLEHAVYSENFAPDVRFVALIASAIVLPALVLPRVQVRTRLTGIDWRVLAFFAVSLLLWLATSANGRYGLIVLLLVGPCLVRISESLMPASAARISILVLLVAQVSMSLLSTPERWYLVGPWTKDWLPYDPPAKALRERALYLSIEPLPLAVLAPFVNAQSSFVNFRGQLSIPTESPRLAALLDRYRGRVRTIGRSLRLSDGKPSAAHVRSYDATFARIGYRIDTGDCFTIPWRNDGNDLLSTLANRVAPGNRFSGHLSAVSCALKAVPRDAADAAREREASELFTRIEKGCPAIFGDQTAVTEPLGGAWSRNYPNIDARLETDGDLVILNRYVRGEFLSLGLISEWKREPLSPPAICRAP